ncbi:GNAT family N-acetyltransferase [Vagococcus xieshaowenii]|uniref:GNAT family N-acetyltransferase n=1 Tax=Vagococcus xieshaowenii TaxID=2562451 RepID=A0A4Z0D4N4_9ENTE|nr:GNAT family N-acetyltransferase [Vagococcus xieshaowenii]QCA29344.1 GNAT family N-acetyltransferase [Vagococcus xieshaowenii]TFZ39364.1 GNAT family N-acetyltransferase [Vagococcus xieshaowenii]
MKLIIKKLDELSTTELLHIMQQRVAVFVVEQNCPYQEIDELDERAIHMWLAEGEEIVAYTRVIPYEQHTAFGRVLVNEDYRGNGYGQKIVAATIAYIQEHEFAQRIEISAQAYLESFYQHFGFESISDIYLEDDIPHIVMELN